ncbi:MAG: nitrogenase [Treponema sp.]|jgi:nitrogenase molybdenum-iron protein alpha chain|nr:nitrogenase [Treponema sp.]
MDYLDAKGPPSREDRLRAAIAFGGVCSQIKTCDRAARNGCTNLAQRKFTESQGCQFNLSLGTINSLRNSVTILHGVVGCGIASVQLWGPNRARKRLIDPKAEGIVTISTNLDESDVITGGERKLREAVLYAERELRPETIVVAVSCVPALIGDDVDAILDDLQKQVSAILIPVHCEGFKTKLMATAYDSVYHGYLKKLVRPPKRRRNIWEQDEQLAVERFRNSRKVNILNMGSLSYQDEVEIRRILESLDLKVTFLPVYAEPEDFQYMLETSLNVSLCGTHDDYFIQHIETKYGVPFIVDSMPIGRKNTDQWLRRIAEHFKLQEEVEALIKNENEELEKALVPFREKLRGKRVYLLGGEIRIVSSGEIMQDLGMEIVGFKAHHYDRFVEPMFDNLHDIDDVLYSVATSQPFETSNIITKIKPDICVVHPGGQNVTSRHGLPLLPLFGRQYNYVGYNGVFEFARRIVRRFRNFEYNKQIQANVPLPFKKEWYEKDPFSYIKAAPLEEGSAEIAKMVSGE